MEVISPCAHASNHHIDTSNIHNSICQVYLNKAEQELQKHLSFTARLETEMITLANGLELWHKVKNTNIL